MIIRRLARPNKIAALLILGTLGCGPQLVAAQSASASASASAAASVAAPAPAPAPATAAAPAPAAAAPGDAELGKKLFQGTARFATGGPSCISCHHVQNDAVAPGGTLASDLTAVASRSGVEAARAMLPLAKQESPFPVMQAAYQGKPLTDNEADALAAFLEKADKQAGSQAAGGYGYKLVFGGAGGVAAMLMFFTLIGQRRKKQSVNQQIYDRQLKTEK